MNAPDKEIQAELLPDEKILWSGQPDPQIIFSKSDILIIPVSIFFCCFAFLYMSNAIMTVINAPGSQLSIIDLWYRPISGIPLVLGSLYAVIGRFIYKAWRKPRTFYAVTSKRVIILTKGLTKNVQSAFIDTLPEVKKFVRASGAGTITFGKLSSVPSSNGNLEGEFTGTRYEYRIPTFYDIANVSDVYEIVSKLRH